MLDSFRKGQRWLTLIFVSIIGLVFVFFLGVGGGLGPSAPTGNVIVRLDDVTLTSRDFEREKANFDARLRQELGDSYDEKVARNFVAIQSLSTMLNSMVFARAAEDLGLQVTQDELRRVVQASPIFIDEDGRFSPALFDRFATYNFGSQRAFIQNFTRSLLGQKFVQLIAGQTHISDSEVDLRTRFDLEEARIAYVAIDSIGLPGDVVLGDDEIEAFAGEHEEELKAIFNERLTEFSEPERVRARHILILASTDADQEEQAAARTLAESARERVIAGEDFGVVAMEISQDVGTAQNGGELGAFAHGDNDPALDEAAFALELGALSEVVRSSYGFHVIRVDEKIEAQPATFESNRSALARDMANRARALELADEQSRRLADAVKSGISLEDAARAEDSTLERTPSLKRRSDGFIPGLGGAQEVLTAAFTLDAGESSPEIFQVGSRRVLIQTLERTGPDETTISSERNLRREQAVAAKKNRVVEAWLNDYRSKLETSGRLQVNTELALGS